MSWFRRHLNWVAILSWVALYPLGYIIGELILSISPYMSTGVYYSIVYIVAALWLFGIDGWVLKQKNRSLWNLLWLIIPFGWIVFLCLENRSYTIQRFGNYIFCPECGLENWDGYDKCQKCGAKLIKEEE